MNTVEHIEVNLENLEGAEVVLETEEDSKADLQTLETHENAEVGLKTQETLEAGVPNPEMSKAGLDTLENSETYPNTLEKSETVMDTSENVGTDPDALELEHSGADIERKPAVGKRSTNVVKVIVKAENSDLDGELVFLKRDSDDSADESHEETEDVDNDIKLFFPEDQKGSFDTTGLQKISIGGRSSNVITIGPLSTSWQEDGVSRQRGLGGERSGSVVEC